MRIIILFVGGYDDYYDGHDHYDFGSPTIFLERITHYPSFCYPLITRSRYFTSPEGFSSSGDVWYDSGEVVLTREA